jgi:hypothetical protein
MAALICCRARVCERVGHPVVTLAPEARYMSMAHMTRRPPTALAGSCLCATYTVQCRALHLPQTETG